jgi:hypothetical protein
MTNKSNQKNEQQKPTEFKRKPPISFKETGRNYLERSIYVDEAEFKRMMLPFFRIIHEENIGWNYFRTDDDELDFNPVKVVIYATDGIRTTNGQNTAYRFYVRYGSFLWSAYDISHAMGVINNIRLGEILEQQKMKQLEKPKGPKRKSKLKAA